MDELTRKYLKAKYLDPKPNPDEGGELYQSEQAFVDNERLGMEKELDQDERWFNQEKQVMREDDLGSIQRDVRRQERDNNMMSGVATIAGAIAGVKPTTEFYDNLNKQARGRVEDYRLREDDKVKKVQRDKLREQMDAGSDASATVRDAYKRLAPDIVGKIKSFDELSAYDIQENLAKPLELYQRAEDRRLQREAQYSNRNEAREDRAFQRDLKADEKSRALTTPYGMANTEDDAKKLKEAHESKQAFDSKLQEIIDLRKQYGAEAYNREAVGRGKQLSKDLLLEYKNLAKLGVLSKSDEDIINAIIPPDPLAFQAVSLVGQDPILHKLEKFKGDSDRDFNTRLETRLAVPNKAAVARREEQVNSQKMVSILGPDGKVRQIPSTQVSAALAAGGQMVDVSNVGKR
jgi:hypothetical protein